MGGERDVARLVVVGGGVTGLAAAHAAVGRARELGKRLSVTVLEGSARFGGNIVTERLEGFLLDGGPDSWVASKPQATALARELGLSGATVGTNKMARRYYVAWDQRLHPVPEGLVLGVPTRIGALARTHLFSWRGKARMALEPLVPARHYQGDEDESIADFATRRLGAEAAERLVAPLLGGISAGDAAELSVRAAFPQLVALEQEHGSLVQGMRAARRTRETAGGGREGSAFVSLAGGLGQLVTVLCERLEQEGVHLRPNTPAQGLARGEGGGWTVRIDGDSLRADRVLLAVPGHVAARLLAGHDERVARALASLRYASTATVFLAMHRRDVADPLEGSGFVVPRALGRPSLAATWVSSKWSGRAPEGFVLLRVFFGGVHGEGVLSGSDEVLTRSARVELEALMGVQAPPLWSKVFRFDRARAQMRVGHLATMRDLRARLTEVASGVHIAGGGYDGVGIPDCIRQGQDAGRALAEG
jgi:protoporphyrinogen/coproporphyrinogen III oxidase